MCNVDLVCLGQQVLDNTLFLVRTYIRNHRGTLSKVSIDSPIAVTRSSHLIIGLMKRGNTDVSCLLTCGYVHMVSRTPFRCTSDRSGKAGTRAGEDRSPAYSMNISKQARQVPSGFVHSARSSLANCDHVVSRGIIGVLGLVACLVTSTDALYYTAN